MSKLQKHNKRSGAKKACAKNLETDGKDMGKHPPDVVFHTHTHTQQVHIDLQPVQKQNMIDTTSSHNFIYPAFQPM
jgi:hypothetical protein